MPVENYGYSIYSNDGSTTFVDRATTAVPVLDIDGNSVIDGGVTVYTYTGTKTFKGLATAPNVTIPMYVSGDRISLTEYSSDTFYIVEGNPMNTVTIEYNSNIIASLKAGQTAQVKCGEKTMQSDIIITVPEIMGAVEEWDGSYTISEGETE